MARQQHHRALRSAATTPARASRHARPATSYREPSSEVESQSSELEGQEESKLFTHESSPNAELTNRRPYRPPLHFSQRRASRSKIPPTSAKVLHTTRKRKRQDDSDMNSPSSGTRTIKDPTSQQDSCSSSIIPSWTSLPYHILALIFEYASYPLCDERTFQSSPTVSWLLKTSRLCRAFAEPALTVLYRSPPLAPMEIAHKLRNLLAADPVPMSYNYRAKVERLQMEVLQTAAYTLPGSGLLDLHGLIYHCPRLLDLELYHQKDFSPFRKLDDSIKWAYPDSLFIALSSNVSGSPTKLRSWRWSSRLAGKKRPIESILDIHKSPSFNGLQKIAFVNYPKCWARKNVEDPQHEKVLSESLAILSRLEHLIFESSTLVNSILLPLLPKNLKHLEIINCSEVDSDGLALFLLSHGSKLRTLTLNHNVSLNLSFFEVLGSSCQQLESLKMNLTYYHSLSGYLDSHLGYEVLLGVDEKPQWPTTLRTIELTQLKKWDVDTAKMFFQSILESADRLVYLRRLVIRAVLDTSWRDRSSFRDEWVGAFERVFKRRSQPPNPHFRPLGAGSSYNSDSDDVPLATQRHISERKKAEPIQGMCEVVSITIDNLRPTETQFVEADFLDSEPSGDEDWDGSEEIVGDVRYAW